MVVLSSLPSSFLYSLSIHQFINSPIVPFIYPFIRLSFHSSMHLPAHPSIHLSIYSPILPFIYPFTHIFPFISLFTRLSSIEYSPIHLSIQPCIHFLIYSVNSPHVPIIHLVVSYILNE